MTQTCLPNCVADPANKAGSLFSSPPPKAPLQILPDEWNDQQLIWFQRSPESWVEHHPNAAWLVNVFRSAPEWREVLFRYSENYLSLGIRCTPCYSNKAPIYSDLGQICKDRKRYDNAYIDWWDGHDEVRSANHKQSYYVALGARTGEASGMFGTIDCDSDATWERFAETFPQIVAEAPIFISARGPKPLLYFERECYRLLPKPFAGELICHSDHHIIVPPSIFQPEPDSPKHEYYQYTYLRKPGRDFAANTPRIDPDKLFAAFQVNKEFSFPIKPAIAEEMPVNARGPQENIDSDYQGRDADLDQIINTSLPEQFGERNEKLFQFARKLKSIDPTLPAEHWHDAYCNWHTKALPRIRTKSRDYGLREFKRAYAAINQICNFNDQARKGAELLVEAINHCLPGLAIAEARGLALAIQHTRMNPFKPFISVRQFAAFAGYSSPATGSVILRGLERKGCLEIIELGDWAGGARIATTYAINRQLIERINNYQNEARFVPQITEESKGYPFTHNRTPSPLNDIVFKTNDSPTKKPLFPFITDPGHPLYGVTEWPPGLEVPF